eukprot:400091_1
MKLKVPKAHQFDNTTTATICQSPMSPHSPITPSAPPTSLTYSITRIAEEYKTNNEILSTLKRIGFNDGTKLSDTLQGMIWRAEKINANGEIETAVIKITNQYLHAHSAAFVKNKLYKVKENVLTEQSILKYLTHDDNCPESIIQFYNFFKTNTDYWLVMQDGGECLFDFIQKGQELIQSGCIDASEWEKVTTVIIKQMIECIQYIHSKNVVHFDISLENFLINDVGIVILSNKNGKVNKIKFKTDDIKIKLCDFGLAQKFTKKDCFSNRICGKKQYKSPEVCYQVKGFNAKQNDIWCLGVCIFILATGGCPWGMAHESDDIYVYAMQYSIGNLLKQWNININKNIIVLLDSIFRFETERANINEIKKYFYQFVYKL